MEDFNDCPPEFINRATVVMVPEDIVMNSVLETFSVQDCDSGLNGVNGTRFSIITGESALQKSSVHAIDDGTCI